MRLPNWRSRLSECVISFTREPFAWGSKDFITFADSCIAAVMEDPVSFNLGTYNEEAGAVAAIGDAGSSDLAELAANLFVEIPPALAHEGDLAIIDAPETLIRFTLGVFLGERIGTMTLSGYSTVARQQALRAFRVP